MARIPETEVMNDPASVDAYTSATYLGGLANFLINKLPKLNDALDIADIGCGNWAYVSSLVSNYPNANLFGYDASALMLDKAREIIPQNKCTLTQVSPNDAEIPSNTFDIVISSLLLHQYLDPMVMWDTIKRIGKVGSKFYVFDLLRVEDSLTCWDIVNGMAEGSSEVFKTDFYNTLRASFTVEEIEQQLLDAGLVATTQTEEIYPNCSVVYITGTL